MTRSSKLFYTKCAPFVPFSSILYPFQPHSVRSAPIPPFSIPSYLKQTENLSKIDIFSFPPFPYFLIFRTFIPLFKPFLRNKKDPKHFPCLESSFFFSRFMRFFPGHYAGFVREVNREFKAKCFIHFLRLMRPKLYGHFLPAHSLSNDAGCFRRNLSFGMYATICIPFATFSEQHRRENKDFSPQRVRYGESCERKTIFVTPFTRLARVRITPRRPRADQSRIIPDGENLCHGCCGLHCGHDGWSHHSADK